MTLAELQHLARIAPHLTVREAVAAHEEGLAAAERWLRASDAYDGIEAYNARVRDSGEPQWTEDSGSWFVLLASDE